MQLKIHKAEQERLRSGPKCRISPKGLVFFNAQAAKLMNIESSSRLIFASDLISDCLYVALSESPEDSFKVSASSYEFSVGLNGLLRKLKIEKTGKAFRCYFLLTKTDESINNYPAFKLTHTKVSIKPKLYRIK